VHRKALDTRIDQALFRHHGPPGGRTTIATGASARLTEPRIHRVERV